LLAQVLSSEVATGKFGFLSSIDHDSRVFSNELIRFLAKQGLSPAFHLVYDPAKKRSLESLIEFLETGIKTIVVISQPHTGKRPVEKIRSFDSQIKIYGSPTFGRRFFVESVGRSGDGIVFPHPGRIGKVNDSLETHFRNKWERSPDFAARQTYDSIRFLVEAIRSTGLNRANIRNAMRNLAPWSGTNGGIEWDPIGQNKREVQLATIKNGKIVPFQ